MSHTCAQVQLDAHVYKQPPFLLLAISFTVCSLRAVRRWTWGLSQHGVRRFLLTFAFGPFIILQNMRSSHIILLLTKNVSNLLSFTPLPLPLLPLAFISQG